MVSVESVKNIFSHYQPLKKVRRYHAMSYIDPLVAPFMYPCWLATHHMWPQKDDFPLYLCKQLFAEYHLHQEVDSIDILGHAGQCQDRFSDKFRHPDAPAPINKWALIGPNLLVMARHLELATVGVRVVGDTRRDVYERIATISTQVHEMSSD